MEKNINSLENDKLIASFMGREIRTDGIGWFDENFKVLKYSDWNSIMPVVEKIEGTKPFYSVSTNADFYYIEDGDTDYPEKRWDTCDRAKLQQVCIISDSSSSIVINSANYYDERINKIKAVYSAVVEFIKWYNKNK